MISLIRMCWGASPGPLSLPPPYDGLPGLFPPMSLRPFAGRLVLCWPACRWISLNIKEGETNIWYLFMNLDPVMYETRRNWGKRNKAVYANISGLLVHEAKEVNCAPGPAALMER